MRALAITTLVWFVAAGCGSSGPGSGFGNGSGDDGGTVFGGDDGGGFGDGSLGSGDGGTNGGQNCSDAAKLVYVLSAENDLYSFSPPSKQFKKIGALRCNTTMTPNSMAVDRNANAWVNYVQSSGLGTDTGGAIFKVSTADASCQPTNIGLIQNWYRIGMGFSTNSTMGTDETLYVAATGGVGMGNAPGLGKIDFTGQRLVTIGPFSGTLAGQSAELTGTGDARLFGFFTTTPVQVAEINKGGGAILNQKALNGVETPAFWAFSFWGGDFYLYTAPDAMLNPQRTSNVTHYSPSGGTIDTAYMTNIGFRIVGAGVSTCAPITPPR